MAIGLASNKTALHHQHFTPGLRKTKSTAKQIKKRYKPAIPEAKK
jgi:hypothetical protein